jgi:Tfp pilus assembly protein PilO
MPGQDTTDMGQTELEMIEHSLVQMEERLDTKATHLFEEMRTRLQVWAAKVAVGSVVTIIVAAAALIGYWNGLTNRVAAIETWKAERVRPIEDYYKDREQNAERLAKIEARLEEIYRLVQHK